MDAFISENNFLDEFTTELKLDPSLDDIEEVDVERARWGSRVTIGLNRILIQPSCKIATMTPLEYLGITPSKI